MSADPCEQCGRVTCKRVEAAAEHRRWLDEVSRRLPPRTRFIDNVDLAIAENEAAAECRQAAVTLSTTSWQRRAVAAEKEIMDWRARAKRDEADAAKWREVKPLIVAVRSDRHEIMLALHGAVCIHVEAICADDECGWTGDARGIAHAVDRLLDASKEG